MSSPIDELDARIITSLREEPRIGVLELSRRLGVARDTRLRLWAEHLERDESAVAGDPASVFDELWRPIAVDQLERVRRGDPRTHRLIELPPASRHMERLLAPIDALLVDG